MKNRDLVIKTPRGRIYINENGKAVLEWNPAMAAKLTRKLTTAQEIVDSEVLRGCEPYVPMQTGMLKKSGILGTEIGSGFVKWIAPYARYQYYSPRQPGSETGELRGPYWFKRWYAASGHQLVNKIVRLFGKK